VIEYDDTRGIPVGYRLERRARKGLVIGGTVTAGALWVASALMATLISPFESSNDDITPLYIPVLGPFITMATANSEGGATALLFIDGVGQAGGIAMLIAGVVAKKSVLVRQDILQLEIAPMVGTHRAGTVLRGRF
jgi:hypothetical protein